MSVQGQRLTHCRQTIKGRHRHFQLITDAIHIQKQMWRGCFSARAPRKRPITTVFL